MIYSEKMNKLKGKNWFRGGKSIFYYQNHLLIEKDNYKRYYTLQFSYKFQHDGDIVSFAWS